MTKWSWNAACFWRFWFHFMIILLILISINESFCIFEEERCLEILSILICAKIETFKSINGMEIHTKWKWFWIRTRFGFSTLVWTLSAQRFPVTVQWTPQNPSFLISAFKKQFISIVAMTHVPLKLNIQQKQKTRGYSRQTFVYMSSG